MKGSFSSTNGNACCAGGVIDKLPARVQVKKIIDTRYPGGKRPLSWDRRKGGTDIIETVDGKTLKLESDGSQSTPQPGWVILLRSGDSQSGYGWTLYGMPGVTG